MEWRDYVLQLLLSESSFDGVSLSIGDGSKPMGIPPIIKATVLMLDRMQKHQGKHNILVFPERMQSIFIFTIVRLLHSISEGRIERVYNPEAFHSGEKLRFGKAVVEFIGIEEHNDKKCMRIRLSDMVYIAPIKFFPLFQKTNSKRLSNYKAFAAEERDVQRLLESMTADEKYINLLSDYRTHMSSSIVYMTSMINTKELLAGCKLCGQNAKEIILVGQANYEGEVVNTGAGQLVGTPAIVLASDLYSVTAMANNRHPIQSIIIDVSNSNALLSQMDALDVLMRLGVQITCVTDVVNSFDLKPFLDREFNLWRWDKSSITEQLYDVTSIVSDKKARNCVKHEVKYLYAESEDISTVMKNLAAHRTETQTLSAKMLKLYEKLYSLAFNALRETVSFECDYIRYARSVLDDCKITLIEEKNYIPHRVYEDFLDVVDCLKSVFSFGYNLPKHDLLASSLLKEKYNSICIVVPERLDKTRVQEYWQMLCRNEHLNTQVTVLYPAEYYLIQSAQFDATIVVGWLKRAIMRKILYSFNTQTYAVLLYDHEKQWQKYVTAMWDAALDSSQNRQIIEKSFNSVETRISTSGFSSSSTQTEESFTTDEFTDIETFLRENKYRRYLTNGGQKASSDAVEAIPVNYVGGFLAFYRTGHTIISASNIIMNDSDKIDLVLPEHLKQGDFVVVREADRDLIKEMADVIIERSGKNGLRDLATKWKEPLAIESLFYSPEEIYRNLQKVGCIRGYQTVRGWVMDDSIIAPQSKQDLEHIAAVTGSSVLNELLDQVFEAAQTVRSAHIQAGKILSVQLRNRIVEALKEYGDIDPFNIWKPIEMVVDGVGSVRILKIIDIGLPVTVEIVDTNRLIDDE